MHTKQFLLSTIGYTVITFALAVLWHIVLFTEVYEQIGYIGREEPGFCLGLISILIQAAVLSYLYPKFKNGLHLLLVMGVFHWSLHVTAAAAKNQIHNVPLFFGIETLYLAVQFGLAIVLFKWVYGK